ncbi:MAG: pilus assembly protein TadG-related protein [Bacillota bacterium]
MMNRLADERGAALVLVAAALVALLGFGAVVIDVGVLYLNRERLSNAADAAALAGSQFLPDDPATAVSTAQHYALRNGIQPGELTVSVGPYGNSITVDVQRQVSLSLAKVLGLTSAQVTGHAKVQVGGADEVSGVVPLGVPDQTLEYGTLYSLKVGGGAGEHGNFGALALGGHGACNYEDNLRDGYQGWLKINDIIETEPGNMSGPTERAIEDRISGHESCTFNNHCLNCPRVIVVPVYQYLGELQGRSQVKIVGFASFFLDGVTGHGKDSYVNGYFIETLSSNARRNDGADYGLRSVKLVE